jgi:hypothetical protein|tara:strand:+ start:327 stop:1355 length:1029 start_codon:yes stop_codon:yes gene_type:complete
MKDKVIIFGPWCGEFSYELSWWNPGIRKIRKEKYKDYYAVHIGYRGRRAMYKDFIEDYVSYPKELEETLKFPAAGGQHVIDVGEVVPENLKEFMYRVASRYQYKKHYVGGGSEEILLYNVDPQMFVGGRHIHDEEPDGDYINYEVDSEMYNEIKTEIKNYFSNGRDTIALMARIRDRNRGENTGGCYLNWKPESWEIFLDRVINELETNIVVISLSTSGASGGAMSFEDTELYKNNKENIMTINFDDDDDSLDRQLALLKATKCSIYGASGSAVLPFFVKTPTFTQQTAEEGFRLKYKWERDLTDNLKNIKIFDKYHSGEEVYNSPPYELFEEFKNFYRSLQ